MEYTNVVNLPYFPYIRHIYVIYVFLYKLNLRQAGHTELLIFAHLPLLHFRGPKH
jgi:hypothetical protein